MNHCQFELNEVERVIQMPQIENIYRLRIGFCLYSLIRLLMKGSFCVLLINRWDIVAK